MKQLMMIFCLLATSSFENVVIGADWQSTLEARFDIVETFDRLEDWKGDAMNGNNYTKSEMPVELDGSPSIWDYYSYWSSSASSNNWIDNHGASSVWNPTGSGSPKSLKMDLEQGDSSKEGPSRFGLYFGSSAGFPDAYSTSGTANSGYDEVYIFYMVKYPSNAFPKSGGVYEYFGYYKFHVLATGFLSAGNPISGSSTYGPEINGHPHLSRCASYCGDVLNTISIKQRYIVADISDDYYWTKNGGFNDFMANEEWFGLEFYYKLGTPGSSNGNMKIWIYDDQGRVTEILNESQMMMPSGKDYKFNKFFFGGNLSFQDEVDAQGLDTTYFIDDFIMNGSRIGPTYFSLVAGSNTDDGEAPIPPSNLHIRVGTK